MEVIWHRNPNEQSKYMRWKNIPELLQPYFYTYNETLETSIYHEEFDTMMYLSDHPMMGAYNKKSIKYLRDKDGNYKKNSDGSTKEIAYLLRTNKYGITLCSDYFGERITDIREAKDGDTVLTGNNNLRGTTEPLYDIRVVGVYTDNMLLFLSHHHDLIQILKPTKLRDQLVEKLKQSLDTYKQITESIE